MVLEGPDALPIRVGNVVAATAKKQCFAKTMLLDGFEPEGQEAASLALFGDLVILLLPLNGILTIKYTKELKSSRNAGGW
ncbi:hypothetical protein BDR06DRAFT_1006739 [Suillus hirtellus]|nr:hypothetical protein BDR06DRAFT_1006739 [Suillus hirtellus]